jgi:hypothetical protein
LKRNHRRCHSSAPWLTNRNSTPKGATRWLDAIWVDKLRAMRSKRESYSDVIIRLAKVEGG